MSLQVSLEQASVLLRDLIAIPTVNPMGNPYAGAKPVERPLVEYLERLFTPFGVPMERQRCSPLHESLLITIPGQTDAPGTLFESHIDTVPADDWADRAFEPRTEPTRIYGRGACDDKGPLVSMILAVLELLESGRRCPQTVYLLAAGDEEYDQTGIKHFVSNCSVPIGRGIFGEPTQVLPMNQHKGTIRWDITVRGRSAHTSRAEIGRNAILDMMTVIAKLTELQDDFRRRSTHPLLSGPSITVTRIDGGRTRNAVPDECTIFVDFRILPGMDREEASDAVKMGIERLDVDVSHSDFQCFAPPLNTATDHPFTQVVMAECAKQLGRKVQPTAEPFGTDACWMPTDVPSIVLGPGDIQHAHAVDEWVDLNEVVDCAAIHHRLMLHDWNEP